MRFIEFKTKSSTYVLPEVQIQLHIDGSTYRICDYMVTKEEYERVRCLLNVVNK